MSRYVVREVSGYSLSRRAPFTTAVMVLDRVNCYCVVAYFSALAGPLERRRQRARATCDRLNAPEAEL